MKALIKTLLAKLQLWLLKLMLMLPDKWKIAMAGGEPLTRGGRTLDPDTQLIIHSLSRQPSFATMEPEVAQARALESVALFAQKPDPGIVTDDFTIPSRGAHKIPVRVYRPRGQDPNAPLMAYWHQGGGVIGNIEFSDAFCRLIAEIVKCPILSVDYRLAPQHKYPAGLEDCLDAYDWALKHAGEFGAPAGRLTIGGDSMGGNFTAIIAQEARRQGLPTPDLQLMLYPATDIVTDFPSHTTFGDIDPLTMETMDWFMNQYLPEGTDKTDPLLCPGLEPDLEGLAPAIIAIAGFDVLADDGASYANKLKEAGVDVTFKCYDHLAHGFTAFMGVVPAARKACEEIAVMVRTAYGKLS